LNSLIADGLDVDHINDYIEQGRAHPDYEWIEKHLYKLRDAYPDIVFLYVYQIREDGCHVVFDLETEDLPADQPGEVVEFDESFRDYIPDLLAGREVKPVISRDTYGFLLTIYTPLYDSQGVCQCYAAVDYSMDLLSTSSRQASPGASPTSICSPGSGSPRPSASRPMNRARYLHGGCPQAGGRRHVPGQVGHEGRAQGLNR